VLGLSGPFSHRYWPRDIQSRIVDGRIAAAFFLLDVSCLGVKDAFVAFMPRSEFDLRKVELNRRETIVERSPAYVRKLVEDAASYASSLAFPRIQTTRFEVDLWRC